VPQAPVWVLLNESEIGLRVYNRSDGYQKKIVTKTALFARRVRDGIFTKLNKYIAGLFYQLLSSHHPTAP
jgi:hypothetical protein